MKTLKTKAAGRIRFIGIVFGLFVLCLIAPPEHSKAANPVTITVNPGESIQGAIDSLPPEGGTVELAEGTHTPSDSIKITSRTNITIRGTGATREDTEIKYGEPRPTFHTFFVQNSRNITIENLYIYSTDTSYMGKDGDAILISPPLIDGITISNIRVERLCAGVRTRNISGWDYPKDDEWNDNITIKDCLFVNCRDGVTWWSTRTSIIMGCEISYIQSWPGINMNRLNLNHVFENNTIHHCSTAGIYSYSSCTGHIIKNNICYSNPRGIYFHSSTTNTAIINNMLRDNSESGILLHGVVYTTNNIQILNNRIYNNGQDGIKISYSGADLIVKEYSVDIESNTIFSNGRDGIRQDLPRYFTIVKNNIIANNSGYGINRLQSDITNSYNNLWNNNNGAGNYNGCSAGTGDISTDPLFADPTNGDFHLKSEYGRWEPVVKNWINDSVTSPCIDAGDPSSNHSNELDHPDGHINMGAYGNTAEASLGTVIPMGTISGTVTDADTGLAIEGVFMSDGVRSDTTDSGGNYTISNIPVGSYTVTASKTGYEDASENSVSVTDGATTTVDFALTQKEPDTTPPEITLKNITVTGSVDDNTVTEVEINGVSVPVAGGTYSYEVDVSSMNTITIIATNGDGKTVTRTINIK